MREQHRFPDLPLLELRRGDPGELGDRGDRGTTADGEGSGYHTAEGPSSQAGGDPQGDVHRIGS